MKQIIAIIRPTAVERVERVEHAMHELGHFPGLTLFRVRGESRGRAAGHAYQPVEWDIEEHDNVMMFVVCSDELVARVVDAISGGAHTGLPGDGVITVSEVSEVVRIRTGERGTDAV